MGAFLQSLQAKLRNLDGETEHIMCQLNDARGAPGRRVLDIGCGYGRLLGLMHAAGMQATGVEINPQIVATNREAGLVCISAEEFQRANDRYDVMLMAHVIEHFAPEDLLRFMDGYLDRLKIGGRLLIATPLMSDYFYDDFDHIRPYQPAGILMVFGENTPQVQYHARNRLALRSLWFRRAPKRVSFTPGRYLRSSSRWSRAGLLAMDLVAAGAFLVSARLFGSVDGWVGVFEKTGP